MNLGLVKSIMQFMTTVGLDSIALNVVKAVRPVAKANLARTACEGVAAITTSYYISSKVNEFMDKKIDEAAGALVNGLKKEEEDVVHETGDN